MSAEEEARRHGEAHGREQRGEAPLDDPVPSKCVCFLVWHDSQSGAIGAIAVDRKGASPRVLARMAELAQFLGYPRIIIKSDQEPSMMAF